MKIAIISDIHADYYSLKNSLNQIKKFDCDIIICAGDFVSYGAFAEETIDLLGKNKICCIRGNHDRWALTNENYKEIVYLNPKVTKFLKSLPSFLSLTIGNISIFICHGSPQSDMQGIYPYNTSYEKIIRWFKQTQADIMIVGHTHRPLEISVSEKLIVNPGSLLLDSIDKSVYRSGTFGILELPLKQFSVHRVMDGKKIKIQSLSLVKNKFFFKQK